MKIIIYNLIVNAIKFSDKGNIDVGGGGTETSLIIWIEDKGVGMTAEQVVQYTNALLIAPTTDTTNNKSMGIGQVIIRELMKELEGTVEVASVLGKGTKVILKWEKRR